MGLFSAQPYFRRMENLLDKGGSVEWGKLTKKLLIQGGREYQTGGQIFYKKDALAGFEQPGRDFFGFFWLGFLELSFEVTFTVTMGFRLILVDTQNSGDEILVEIEIHDDPHLVHLR
jgi:hypothetical protein